MPFNKKGALLAITAIALVAGLGVAQAARLDPPIEPSNVERPETPAQGSVRADKPRHPDAPRQPSQSRFEEVGEPFKPWANPDANKDKTHSYQMSCEVVADWFVDGSPGIFFKNTGSETIPAGSIIVMTKPDGSKYHHTTWKDIKPGSSTIIKGPTGATSENFPCTAVAKGVPPEMPESTNAPGSNQNLPPKLVCEFSIVDGKVVITWTNVGGSPVPAWRYLKALTPNGKGLYLQINKPLAPGETIQYTADGLDPSQIEGMPCLSGIKKV